MFVSAISGAKKFFAYCVCLALLLLWLAFPLTAFAAINQEEALTLLYQRCEDELGYTQSQLALFQIEPTDEGGWVGSFHIKEGDFMSDSTILFTVTSGGEISHFQGPQEISFPHAVDNAFLESRFSLESMATWVATYAPYVESGQLQATDDTLPTFFDPHTLSILQQPITLPGQDHLPKEEAISLAQKAISRLPGWSEEKLALFVLRYSLFFAPENSSPFYQFFWQRASQADEPFFSMDEKASDQAYQEYKDKLFPLFGGDSGSTPLYIQIQVDGITGEIVLDPAVFFPGVNIPNWWDFFIIQ
ncbi:MAG: hypothetical protein GX786_07935 [Clostridiales bacterium]|nr:hypothetical protein [Clostridiales bacterium]